MSLRNDAPKVAIVEAMAAAVLKPKRLNLFRAVVKVYETALKERQPIAHGWLSRCAELPDALIFINTRDWLSLDLDKLNTKVRNAFRAKKPGVIPEAIRELERKKAELAAKSMAYREADFRRIIRDINSASECLMAFHNIYKWDRVSVKKRERDSEETISSTCSSETP